MISQKAKYALRALAALAQADPDVPMLISEIAVQQSIPKKFLEQILLDLKRSGGRASRAEARVAARRNSNSEPVIKTPLSNTENAALTAASCRHIPSPSRRRR